MELQTGIGLAWQQYWALLKKNALLSWRSKTATFVRLFSSLLFLLILFAVQKSEESSAAHAAANSRVTDPKVFVPPPIADCDIHMLRKPCFDFVWSGNGSVKVTRIVSAIMANNPGRRIRSSKVKSFRTKNEAEAWLYGNQMHTSGALHFAEINSSVISYGIQTNATGSLHSFPLAFGFKFRKEDIQFKYQIPLQIAAEREIARSFVGAPNFSWNVGLKEFSQPAKDGHIDFSVMSEVGPTFILAFAMFGFVLQISSVVMEKELGLREAMSMMGLYDFAYWFSWITWEGIFVLISSLFIVLFGMMFQFDFFKKNSFAVLFLVFYLFQLNMTGFAFLVSAFISKSTSASAVGFLVFIVSSMTQAFNDLVYESSSIIVRRIWSMFPPNHLVTAMSRLTDATASPLGVGISWSRSASCPPNSESCKMTIKDVYLWLTATFCVWIVFAIYFDNIIPNAHSIRKPIFYFLNLKYWIGSGNKAEEGSVCHCNGSAIQQEYITPDDEDVLEEENTVKLEASEGTLNANVAVQIRGLVKTYAGTGKYGCCNCKKTPPYHAIKGLWINFAKDQLFCLLGPNGAGKTTAINCLIGLTPLTRGDALIYGYSIRSSIGMSNIRRLTGVCPQCDILWNTLSGQEHLHLFASIKGLPHASITSVAQELLAKVRLGDVAKVRSQSYSGGMKRRLSVAIALIGDPKLLILDEPTTGMDPIARRHVWDVIQDAKKGRSIVLTTHSMEEADVLSDRIGIMAKGRLRCIGTSIRLKSKFGTGFITNVNFVEVTQGEGSPFGAVDPPIHQKAVKQYFKNKLDVVPAEETTSFLTFVIPRNRESSLTEVFGELEDRKREFGIADIQLGLTTLEEVFLNIVRQAELESALAENKLITLTLNSGASAQIPVGARFVGIPGTVTPGNPRGIMVEVYWEQDDSGAFCISGHSTGMPAPTNVQSMISAAPSSHLNCFRRNRGPTYGIVINPESIRPTSASL